MVIMRVGNAAGNVSGYSGRATFFLSALSLDHHASGSMEQGKLRFRVDGCTVAQLWLGCEAAGYQLPKWLDVRDV